MAERRHRRLKFLSEENNEGVQVRRKPKRGGDDSDFDCQAALKKLHSKLEQIHVAHCQKGGETTTNKEDMKMLEDVEERTIELINTVNGLWAPETFLEMK